MTWKWPFTRPITVRVEVTPQPTGGMTTIAAAPTADGAGRVRLLQVNNPPTLIVERWQTDTSSCMVGTPPPVSAPAHWGRAIFTHSDSAVAQYEAWRLGAGSQRGAIDAIGFTMTLSVSALPMPSPEDDRVYPWGSR